MNILDILDAEFPNFISGEDIAKRSGQTRANVWKTIKKLREQGIDIEGINNKGYRISSFHNRLSRAYLQAHLPNILVVVEDCVDSTLSSIKQYAHHKEPVLFIANEQTAGRGRFDRSFLSSKGQGIYMTYQLTCDLPLTVIPYMTVVSALAICDMVEHFTPLTPSIKWLNDVYINNKKLAGILCLGEIDLESTSYKSISIGIGINTHLPKEKVPLDLLEIITSLQMEQVNVEDRVTYILFLIKRLNYYYQMLQEEDYSFMERYRSLNFLIGKWVYRNNDSIPYKVVGISDQAHILLEDEMGNQIEMNSGEVSLHEANAN